ncbi:hypothetical protein FRB99_007742, partial [Tulasnella sp. 403]
MLTSWCIPFLFGALVPLAAGRPAGDVPPPPSRNSPCNYMWTKTGDAVPIQLFRPDQDGTRRRGEVSLQIKYLAHGNSGCVYTVEGGYLNHYTNTPNIPAVLKVHRVDRIQAETSKFQYMPINEIQALNENQRLFDELVNNKNGVQFIVMKKMDGKFIFETTAWKKRFPNNHNPSNTAKDIDDCEQFMQSLYQKVIE